MAEENLNKSDNKNSTENDFLLAQIRKLDAEVAKIKSSLRPGVIRAKYFGLGLGLVPLIIGYTFLAKPFFQKSKLENEVTELRIKKNIFEVDSLIRVQEDLKLKNITINGKADSIDNVLTEYIRENDSLRLALDEQNNGFQEEKVSILAKYEGLLKEASKEARQNSESGETNKDTVLIYAQARISEQKAQVVRDIKASEAKIKQQVESSFGKEGWIYAGHFDKGTFGKTRKLNVDNMPEVGKKYSTSGSTYLREGRPKFPSYSLPRIITQLPGKTKVEVLYVESDIGFNKVWVKVRVIE